MIFITDLYTRSKWDGGSLFYPDLIYATKKFPTLLEFHRFLFGTEPANLHNSMVDVLVCLRCFLKTCRQIHICEDEFDYMIRKCLA